MPVTRMMDIIGMLETPPNYILSEDVSRNKGHIAAIYFISFAISLYFALYSVVFILYLFFVFPDYFAIQSFPNTVSRRGHGETVPVEKHFRSPVQVYGDRTKDLFYT